MKKIFYITAFILATASLNAQTVKEEMNATTIPILKEKIIDEPTVTIAQQMPEFPGGENGMRKFIVENIKYPTYAKQAGIEGKVYIKFLIDKEGNISNIQCLRGPHACLNNESMRVVSIMPAWKPAMQDGAAVNFWFTLPIDYTLN